MIPSPAKLEEIEVTYRHAARIWWAFFWRTVLLTGLASMALACLEGSAFGLPLPEGAAAAIHRWPELCLVQSAVLAALIGIAMLRSMLRRSFGHFRIVLAKHRAYYTEPF